MVRNERTTISDAVWFKEIRMVSSQTCKDIEPLARARILGR